MYITYDRESDVLAITLRDASQKHGDEVAPGVILLLDEKRELIALEILDASKRVDGDPATVTLHVLEDEPAVAPA